MSAPTYASLQLMLLIGALSLFSTFPLFFLSHSLGKYESEISQITCSHPSKPTSSQLHMCGGIHTHTHTHHHRVATYWYVHTITCTYTHIKTVGKCAHTYTWAELMPCVKWTHAQIHTEPNLLEFPCAFLPFTSHFQDPQPTFK